MKAVCTNDPSKGAGYGILHITDVPLSGTHRFSIQRASDRKFLCQLGWQDTEEFLSPMAERSDTTSLLLDIGPQVLDRLDPLETYRLALDGSGTMQRGGLALESLVFSAMGMSGSLASVPFAPAAPAPAPDPTPEPIAVPAPPVPELVLMAPEPAQQGGSRAMLALGLAAVLVLGGLGGWYWYSQQSKSANLTADQQQAAKTDPATPPAAPEAPKTETPAAEQAPAEAPAPVPAPAPASDPAPGSASGSASVPTSGPASDLAPAPAPATPAAAPRRAARAVVTEFMRGQGAPDAAYALNQSLTSDATIEDSSSPQGQDARFLLLEYAAEGGVPQAMFELARIYDPTEASSYGTIVKDAQQALDWYEKALQAGVTDATARLESVKQWVAKKAK